MDVNNLRLKKIEIVLLIAGVLILAIGLGTFFIGPSIASTTSYSITGHS